MNLRKYKIANMAVFDFIVTFIFVFFIHLYMWKNPLDIKKDNRTYMQYFISLILLFISFIGLAIIFHYIFGIKSALSAYLGFNNMPPANR
jgi:hypothetical protein